MKELDSVYDPQRNTYNKQIGNYNKQISGLAPRQEADMKGLEATKTNAFGDIVTGANRRGVAFGGIPLEEQNRYLGESYLPAVANLKGRYATERFNLGQKQLDLRTALSDLARQQRLDAYKIRDFELAEAARAASSGGGGGSGGFSFGGGGSGVSSNRGDAGGGYGYSKKADGGFAFVDPYGNSISAATYAANTGISFRDLLQTMANQGDGGAARALGFVGNFGEGNTLYDPRKIRGNENLFNSLTWGTPYTYSPGAGSASAGRQTRGQAGSQGGGGGGF